jgi:ATP-dependent Clp protease ATP-binding subunit ClpC
MNYNFTDRVRKVLAMAREEAIRLQHDYVGTEHILLGLIREGEGVAAAVLMNLNVDLEQIHERIEDSVRKGKATIALGELPYTSRAKKVLEYAMAEARELNHSYVGTEHLLLGLLREEKGIAAQVLNALGVTLEDARAETLKLLGSDVGPSQPGSGSGSGAGSPATPKGEKKSKTPALDHFCRDLTELAREDKLDPTIGRTQEIERVMEVLSRRKKNNPVLIGEPGVGKTAIVEGLAQLIARRQLPGQPAGQPRARAGHGGRDRGHEVPRPVRGAAEGDHERDRAEQERDPVHRRAAHAGRRGRGGGRHRRVQHAEAGARAR